MYHGLIRVSFSSGNHAGSQYVWQGHSKCHDSYCCKNSNFSSYVLNPRFSSLSRNRIIVNFGLLRHGKCDSEVHRGKRRRQTSVKEKKIVQLKLYYYIYLSYFLNITYCNEKRGTSDLHPPKTCQAFTKIYKHIYVVLFFIFFFLSNNVSTVYGIVITVFTKNRYRASYNIS